MPRSIARATPEPSPTSQSKERLPGAVSQTSGLPGVEGARGVDHGGKRLIVDRDQLGRIARGGEALRHHHRDRVADMPHPVARDRRMRRDHRGRPVAVGDGAQARDRADPVAGEIFAGKDGEDPRRGNGGGGVNRADARMRMRRAQHEGIGLARTVEVVEVIAATGNKAPILDAPDRLTDAELLHGTSPPTPHIGGEDRFCYNGRPRFC